MVIRSWATDNDSAPRDRIHGPWSRRRFCMREQTTRSINTDGHWQEWITLDGLKKFYWAQARSIARMGRPRSLGWGLADEVLHHLPRWGLFRVCHIKPPYWGR